MSLITPDRGVRLSTGVFTDEELDYIESCGPDYFPSEELHPVGETTWHYLSIKLAFELLERVFPEPSNVFIAANHFLYWDRTQRGQVVSADLYVVKGGGRKPRGSYKLWEENSQQPDVVFEFASKGTWLNDQNEKKAIYERILKVPEYFLFDPMGRYLPEQLRGYRLEQGIYQPIIPEDGHLTSHELGLNLVASGQYLRFLDPATGALIPTPQEVEESRLRAEAEVARLRAELEALRSQKL